MRTFIIGWLAALGLCVGSFLTVVTSRVPVGGSILSPPSTCPGCGVRIRWFDNIPVLSWIVLSGHCRHCGRSIPWRYPALELGVGALFGLIGLLARPLFVPLLLTGSTGATAIGTSWLIHRRVSRRVTGPSVLIVVVAALVTLGVGILRSG